MCFIDDFIRLLLTVFLDKKQLKNLDVRIQFEIAEQLGNIADILSRIEVNLP